MENERKQPLRLSQGKNKLIPRDINDSLGKLPPQALDMEESVLGALLLERSSYDIVSKFLKPEHFYKESHKEVYQAAIDLAEENAPIDMRTVAVKLEKKGKLEIVGGRFFIVELTTKVSSSANIEYHARIIVERAIKRTVIEAASALHHDSYDDTTDSFEILEKAIKSLQFLHDTTTVENVESKIKELWKTRLLTEQPPAEIPLISIQGIIVATLGNHSLLLGKKKSRKTLFLVWLMHQYFSQNNQSTEDDVLCFDTEQGKSHVWKMREKLTKLTGLNLPIFFMRGMSPSERRDFIKGTVKYWKRKPKILIVDGVRDLMTNINDPVETTEVIVWLESLIIDYNVHIIEVLHLNKGDNNARGHIGTELLNKAQITYELTKDEKSGITEVKCESARDEEFKPFYLEHGPKPDSLPMIVDMPVEVAQEIAQTDSKRDILIKIFDGRQLTGGELTTEVKANFKTSKHKTTELIREFRNKGWIVKDGSHINDPTAKWRLMINDSGQHFVPVADTSQRSLFDAYPGETVVADNDSDQFQTEGEDLPF